MTDDERERLGRIARDAWVVYCRETGDEKPAHVAPWEELGEWDREADRRIAEAVDAEVRRQERARIRSMIEHMCRASAYTDAVFGDGEAATDGALHALNKVLLALEVDR